MICVLENILIIISKNCSYFDLSLYFCFILRVEVLIQALRLVNSNGLFAKNNLGH